MAVYLILLLLPGSVGLVGASSVVSLPASSGHFASFPAGDTVILSCSDETNTTRNLSDIVLIIWRKENGSHQLHFVSDREKNATNFTDPRISFLDAQIPPVLRITDARPEDEGNYTCEVTMSLTGKYRKSWTLHISESSTFLHHLEILRWMLAVGFLFSCSAAIAFVERFKRKKISVLDC